jgi:hypothetical protein
LIELLGGVVLVAGFVEPRRAREQLAHQSLAAGRVLRAHFARHAVKAVRELQRGNAEIHERLELGRLLLVPGHLDQRLEAFVHQLVGHRARRPLRGAPQPAQTLDRFAGVARPAIRILVEQQAHERVDLGRRAVARRREGQRLGLLRQVRERDVDRRACVEQRAAAHHLIDQRAERVDVAPRVEGGAAQELGRRGLEPAGDRSRTEPEQTGAQVLRARVEQDDARLGRGRIGHEHVARVQRAVAKPLGVKRRQRLDDRP